jgi:DNA-binding CsgD family transcriptional regulator
VGTSAQVGFDAFGRGAWRAAYAALTDADREAPLDLDGLERLATAAHLIGSDDWDGLWERTHRECLRGADPARAARCAFWLAFALMSRGEAARGSGWLARAQRLIDDGQLDCAERGYLLIPQALGCLEGGDADGALALFVDVCALGDRFGDADLATIGRLGHGQSLLVRGECGPGVALLDEAIVAVTAGEVSPLAAGLVYCAAIESCQHIFDLRRAQEWTAALSRWCDDQPDLAPYRGQCLVHRAEIMQLHGAWSDAVREAAQAAVRLAGEPAAADALYRQAELHRLCGRLDRAEDGYRAASLAGREPQPGLALLRLAQGRTDAAVAAIRRVLDEATAPVTRARILGPYVEIVLAVGDITSARIAADELGAVAGQIDAPYLHALAAHATSSVLLAEGDGRAALPVLRRAWGLWRGLDAPYEAARSRVLIGLACRAVGDGDTAEMELDAARLGFEALGATVDLARVESLLRPGPAPLPAGLTAREVEVLTLVAEGRTNREIASALFISEHTVARHLQNIFAKTGVTSRTAAATFAHGHRLL